MIDSNLSSCVVGINAVDNADFLRRSLFFYIKRDGHDPSLNRINVNSVIDEDSEKANKKLDEEITDLKQAFEDMKNKYNTLSGEIEHIIIKKKQ